MRLVLVGAGQIAAELARTATRQGHEIVGVVDVDPAKLGRDAGDVLGCPPMGITVVADVAEVSGKADVAAVATSSRLEAAALQLRASMAAGLDVVSTCEQLAYPWRTNADLAGELDREARSHGVTLLGTGINPGCVMDSLVLVVSAPCTDVRHALVRRVLDAGSRRSSFRDKVGAGTDEATFRERAASGSFGHAGLAESAWMVADGLGLDATRSEAALEPVVDAGNVLGTAQWVSLLAGDTEVVRLEMTMAINVSDPADTIVLEADPPVCMTLAGGIPGDAGTAGVVINAARQLAAARPGLVTMLDLPLVRTRPRNEYPTTRNAEGRT
jgi:4-hydroxy-tetrahydrodipicolinate reductase